MEKEPVDKSKDSSYTEKDYWEGRIPDDFFEEYLKKYGYEYTPEVDTTRFKLDSPFLHNEEEDNDIN